MEVILLERVAKLGQMGEVVRVKDGYARNFLLPRGKALRATKDNRAKFDGMKADLEARNLELKGEAAKAAEKVNGKNVIVIRQASSGSSSWTSYRSASKPMALKLCTMCGGSGADTSSNLPLRSGRRMRRAWRCSPSPRPGAPW